MQGSGCDLIGGNIPIFAWGRELRKTTRAVSLDARCLGQHSSQASFSYAWPGLSFGLAVLKYTYDKSKVFVGRMLGTKRRHLFLWAPTDVLLLEVIREGTCSSPTPLRTSCRLQVALCCRISEFTSGFSHLKTLPL